MKMALVLSIIVKALGAILEFGNQILITRFGGVSLYGSYSFYVSVAEIVCWLLFSGIVKTNAFYVANEIDISAFRKTFFTLYALPLLLLASVAGSFFSVLMILAFIASYLYAMQLNLSSFLLACRKFKFSLFGEYVISRAIQTCVFLVLIATNSMSEFTLLIAYVLGFFGSVTFFVFVRTRFVNYEIKDKQPDTDNLVKKYVKFQLTDIANGMVNQAPVIIQYAFAGAFQAGVLSVILITKKLISFVAGPTAKVYLPEFAKRYAEGDMAGLKEVFREIILLQMCFVMPICLVLMGAPASILGIYNSELVGYENYMTLTAFVFMAMALFGPQGNFLSMVGKESIEAVSKWLSLLCMIVVMVLTYGNDLFVLYGIFAQVVADSLTKLYFVNKTLKGFPLRPVDFIKLTIPFVSLVLIVRYAIPFSDIAVLGIACLCAMVLSLVYAFIFFGNVIIAKILKRGHNDG